MQMRSYPYLATRVALLFGVTVLLTTVAYTAQAASIRFDATGENSLTTEGFFGIEFASGSGFIESFTLDLSGERQAFFDLDGRSNYQGQLEPVVTSMTGLVSDDIEITRSRPAEGNPDHPTILTFSFLAQSFGVGDGLRFSVDTDYLADDPARGGALATTAMLLGIMLEDGTQLQSGLAHGSTLQSVASIGIGAPVPEPGTALLVATGMVLSAGARRSRRSP